MTADPRMNSGDCSKCKAGKRVLRTFNLEVALFRASKGDEFSNDQNGHLQAANEFVNSFEGEQFSEWKAMHSLTDSTRRAVHYCRHLIGDVGTKGARGVPGKEANDRLLDSLRGNCMPHTIGTWGAHRYSSKR